MSNDDDECLGNLGLRWTNLQSSQDGPVGVQSLLQDTAGGESIKASDHHPQGCLVQSSASDLRVYVSIFHCEFCVSSSVSLMHCPTIRQVCWRSERVAGTASRLPQDSRQIKGEGTRRHSVAVQQARRLI